MSNEITTRTSDDGKTKPILGNKTQLVPLSQRRTTELSNLAGIDSGNFGSFITRSHTPLTIAGQSSHTLAELPKTEPTKKLEVPDPLNFDALNRTVVSDDHGLLTEILMAEPIRSLFNQNVQNIHKSPAKLNQALTVIQGLVLALAQRSTYSSEEIQEVEKDSIQQLKLLGVDVSVEFTLDNLDVVFKSDNLAKFFNNPVIPNLYTGKNGKEQLAADLAILLELGKPHSDRDAEVLDAMKEHLYDSISQKAAAKGVQVNLDNDPKNLLNTAYVNDVLSLLTLKSTSDQIFRRHYGDDKEAREFLAKAAEVSKPANLWQRFRERISPGQRQAALTAQLCDAVYGVTHDANRVIALSDIHHREDAYEVAAQRYSDVFSQLRLTDNELKPSHELNPDMLAAAVMNNLVEGTQLMASDKTVRYIFLASHIKRAGALTKREREDFAMSLIADLKARMKSDVDPRFLDALRKKMGDGRFVHFLTNHICTQLMYQEIGVVALNDIQEKGLTGIGAVEEFKMDMASAADKNYTPKEQVVANMIIRAMDEIVREDPSFFRAANIKDAKASKPGDPTPLQRISDAVAKEVRYAGPNLNMGMDEGKALFLSLIEPVYNNIRFYVMSSHNLAAFLEHVFPKAQGSAADLSRDFLGRLKILQKLNLAVSVNANMAQRISKDLPLDLFNYDEKDSKNSFELYSGDTIAPLDVREAIVDEAIREYGGLKKLEELTDRDMTPKPILAGDDQSDADFGQLLYKAIVKRFNFTPQQREDFDNLYLLDHNKKRFFDRRTLLKAAGFGIPAALGLGGVGAAYLLNEPPAFVTRRGFTLNDLRIAEKNGDLDNAESQYLLALKDLVEEVFEPSYSLTNNAMSSPRVTKDQLIFAEVPLADSTASVHFDDPERYTFRLRDTQEFIGEIKKSFEHTVFKGLDLSEKEKIDFAKKAMDQLHALIDNYEDNSSVFGFNQNIPAVFQPIIMDSPDPRIKKPISIVFFQPNVLKTAALGVKNEKVFNNFDISVRSLDHSLKAAFHIYKASKSLSKRDPAELRPELVKSVNRYFTSPREQIESGKKPDEVIDYDKEIFRRPKDYTVRNKIIKVFERFKPIRSSDRDINL